MNGKIVFRIVSLLVMIAAIAGIAYFAYNAGVTQGSPITVNAPEGQSAPAPYYHGYGMPWHTFGFGFGCFGVLIVLFLFIAAMKAFRFAVFGPRFGHHMGMHRFGHHMRGGWSERGVPPMVEEWHKRMHGEQTPQNEKA